jgi:hypothetical protein
VMISQNRADEKRQVLADHQWQTVQEEDQQNQQLLDLSNQILDLTKAIHQITTAQSPTHSNGTQPGSPRGAAGESVDVPTERPPQGLEPGKSRP